MTGETKAIYEFGPFQLDGGERVLLREGAPVALTPKALEVLLLLVERHGHIVEKEELINRVWADSVVEEGNLKVTVSMLRKALGDGRDGEQYVETVPRRGYRFVATVTEERDEDNKKDTPEPIASAVAIKQDTAEQIQKNVASLAPARMRNLFPAPSIVALLVVVVSLIAGLIIYSRYLRRVPVVPASEIRSIGVLPLTNLSGDSAQEYFADGMTEALIADLARISALRVISRTSVMQYKGSRKSLPEIARELNVDAVIEGSVQRSGDRVRITAQLIQAATDRPLWTATYDRDLRDVLGLQSEVAGAIAREIQVKLTPQEQTRMSTARNVNTEAYDYYLRGKSRGHRITNEDNKTAIEMLEHAVAIDPTFAAAYAELAQVYTRRLNTFEPDKQEWEQKAFGAAEKALALDPDLAEAHLAHAILLWTHAYHFPHERAVQECHRALSLNPNLDEAHLQLGGIYLHIGLFDKALQETQTAVAINPSNILAQYRIGTVYLHQGRDEDALAVFHKFPDAGLPSLWDYQTAWALFNLGKREEALQIVENSLGKYPEDRGGALRSMAAMLFAATGDDRKVEQMITAAQIRETAFIHFHHTAYSIACAYALLNKPALAIEWLQKAAEDGFPCYPLFERDHNLDNLRQNPRFIAFMAKQKEQWEYYKATL